MQTTRLTRGFDFRCLKQKEAEEGGEPHLTIPAAPLCPAGFDAKAVSQPLPGQIARYTGWRKIHRPPTVAHASPVRRYPRPASLG